MRKRKSTNEDFEVTLESGNKTNLKITESRFNLGEIAKGYSDQSENIEGGVTTFNGKINIRPKFQRANVVSQKKAWKSKLIQSVLNNKPISVMHFGIVNDKPYKYIVIDGQQRLMTLCGFINDEFPIRVGGKSKIFSMLPSNWQERIRSYEIPVYLCEGSEDDMREWFGTINQELAVLTEQELNNAAYCSDWCELAKRTFSTVKANADITKENGDVMDKTSRYYYGNFSLNLEPNRQDVLEMALDWITLETMGIDIPMYDRIPVYMFNHMNDNDISEITNHYKSVIDWAYSIFGENIEQKCAKNVEWGRLYALYHNSPYNVKTIREEAEKLFMDVDVTANSAVFEYVLMDADSRKVSMLSIRAFSNAEKLKMFKMQGGICPIDGKPHKIQDFETHHIIAWENGGKTDISNGMLISKDCHNKILHAELTYNKEELLKLRNEKFPAYLAM